MMERLSSDKTYRNMVRIALSFLGDVAVSDLPDAEVVKNIKENIAKILPQVDKIEFESFIKYLASKDVLDNDLLGALSLIGINAEEIGPVPGQQAKIIIRRYYNNYLKQKQKPQDIKQFQIEPAPIQKIVKDIKKVETAKKVAMAFLNRLEG